MRDKYRPDDQMNAFGQPGVLEWGLFLTISRSQSHKNHWLFLTPVNRYTAEVGAVHWRWDTAAMPVSIYRETVDTYRAMLDGCISKRYGIQEEFPE